MTRSRALAAIPILAFALSVAPLSAEDLPGALAGTVTDASGAPLPGVRVTLVPASPPRATATGSDGGYRFERVPPGAYQVSFELEGFSTAVVAVGIRPGLTTTVDRSLILSEVLEEIVVTSNLEVATAGLEPLPVGVDPDAWNRQDFDAESYDRLIENRFLDPHAEPLSTFAIDVDSASYANVRRFLEEGERPPADAVRIEELLNAFPDAFAYPQPEGDVPFSVTVEVGAAPWSPSHRLVRIGLRGRSLPPRERPPANLVFLVDVSGSMAAPNKLPWVQESLRLLADQLHRDDRVAIVVYAGASGVVLEPTYASDRAAIHDALDRLEAGGSTNGGEGIELAYRLARAGFIAGGVNRVILATDGDWNVGTTDEGALVRLVREQANEQIAITVLGFGMGNYKDDLLESLADEGDGNYAYVDSLNEARRVLVEQVDGTLVTIAKEVKIQVEVNPARVASYRLLGYENRLLAAEDFDDDAADGGEIGAGHTVTALYEVVPSEVAGHPGPGPRGRLRYQKPAELRRAAASDELMTVSLRYQPPAGGRSRLLQTSVADLGEGVATSPDLAFAAALAATGMLLRDSPHAGAADWDLVERLLAAAATPRAVEVRRLVQLARELVPVAPPEVASLPSP